MIVCVFLNLALGRGFFVRCGRHSEQREESGRGRHSARVGEVLQVVQNDDGLFWSFCFLIIFLVVFWRSGVVGSCELKRGGADAPTQLVAFSPFELNSIFTVFEIKITMI